MQRTTHFIIPTYCCFELRENFRFGTSWRMCAVVSEPAAVRNYGVYDRMDPAAYIVSVGSVSIKDMPLTTEMPSCTTSVMISSHLVSVGIMQKRQLFFVYQNTLHHSAAESRAGASYEKFIF